MAQNLREKETGFVEEKGYKDKDLTICEEKVARDI